MDLRLQAKILRVLQDKEFYRVGAKSSLKSGARIIAATNRNLEEAVENKQFREDLYHRLNVILIMIPPLREHKEDIPLLAKHFVEKVEQESNHGKIYISPEVLKLLQHYEWSGNIRELENTIKRAVILSSGGTIQPEHLHSHLSKKLLDSELEGISPVVQFQKELYNLFKNVTDWEDGRIYEDAIQSVEKALFQNILEKNAWNQSQAASVLGINRNTLRRKIEEHKLKKDASKENS
jgi:two-component system nitrogen regulation response regulator GlnG